MNEPSLSPDHGPHSGEWDPSASDETNIIRFHVRRALAAVAFLHARARATNSITDTASAPAERGQALLPILWRDASGLGQKSAALITTFQGEPAESLHAGSFSQASMTLR